MNRTRVKKILPFLILLLPAILFFSRTIFKGEYYFAFDTLKFLYPWNDAVNVLLHNTLISDPVFQGYLELMQVWQGIQNGYLPLWSDNLFCGMPFLMMWQCPIKALLAMLFSPLVAHTLLLFIHLYLCGIFSYLFLRRRHMSVLPALTGAAAWMFNGYIMVWFESEFSIMFAAVLPAALWMIDRAVRRQQILDWLLLALINAYAMAIVFPHLMYYYFICSGTFLLFLLWQRNHFQSERRKTVLRTIGCYVITVFIAITCTLGFWVIAAGQTQTGQRSAFSPETLYMKTGQLPLQHALTMIHPELFGIPIENNCFIPGTAMQCYNNYNELAIYCGVVILMLALIGVFRLRRGDNLFFLAMGILSFWCAAGSFWYPYMAQIFPGLAFSTPTRVLFLTGFCLAMLSASGMQVLLHHRRKGILTSVPVSLVALLLLIIFLVNTESGCRWLFQGCLEMPPMAWVKEFNDWSSIYVMRSLAWAVSGALLMLTAIYLKHSRLRTVVLFMLLGTACAEIFSFGWRYNTVAPAAQAYPETAGISVLQKDKQTYRIAMVGNAGGENCFRAFGLESIGGYASVLPLQYAQFFHMLQSGEPSLVNENLRYMTVSQFSPTLLSLANVKYILMPPMSQMKMPEYLEPIYKGDMQIFRNKMSFPRSFFVPGIEMVDSDIDAANKLCAFTPNDFLRKIIVKKADYASSYIPGATGEKYRPLSAPVLIEEKHPGYLKLSFNVPCNGWIFISNSYDPSWKAWVDNLPGQVIRANFTFQAVPVSAGQHTMILRYLPVKIILSTIISYSCFTILIFMIFLVKFNPKKRREMKI